MTRANTNRYTLHHELTDCSLTTDFADYSNKRLALRIARDIANGGPDLDCLNVVVMDNTYDVAVGVFPFKAARAA